jgi:hypothetical protein
MILSGLIVWLLVVHAPNGEYFIVDRFDSLSDCMEVAENEYRSHKTKYTGKCTRATGSLAPI